MVKMSIINNLFQKAAQQTEAIYALNQPPPIGVTQGKVTTASNSGAGAFGPPRQSESVVHSLDLGNDVFRLSIDELLNLWLARFGNEWIDVMVLEDDQFYKLAYQRLKQLGEVEVHFLTDRARFVCRKPE
jgi:hypothetical protein